MFIFEQVTEILKSIGIIEKAGVPIGTVSGNYQKTADNPSVWEWIPHKNHTENNTQRRIRIANTATLITGIPKLNVNKNNYLQVGNNYLTKMQNEVDSRNVICKVNGKQVTDISRHIYIQRHSLADRIQRTEVLPFVLPIIEQYGRRGLFTKDPKGDFQEVVGRAQIKNSSGQNQNVGIAVVVADNGKGGQTVKFISVFVVDNRLIKSYPTSVLADTCHTSGDELSHRLGTDFQSSASNINIPSNITTVNKSFSNRKSETLLSQIRNILKRN